MKPFNRLTIILVASCYPTLCLLAGPEPVPSGKEMKQVAPAPSACDYSWTGFYIGANAGGAWGNADLHTDVTGGFGSPNQALVSDLDTRSFSPDGFTGGGELEVTTLSVWSFRCLC